MMAKNTSFFTGLIVGGIVGGIATLLTTPSSGKELRANLQANRKRLDTTLQQLKNESIILKNQMKEAAIEGTQVVKEVSADIKNAINQFKQEIEPHKIELQKEIDEVEKKIKQLEQTLH